MLYILKSSVWLSIWLQTEKSGVPGCVNSRGTTEHVWCLPRFDLHLMHLMDLRTHTHTPFLQKQRRQQAGLCRVNIYILFMLCSLLVTTQQSGRYLMWFTHLNSLFPNRSLSQVQLWVKIHYITTKIKTKVRQGVVVQWYEGSSLLYFLLLKRFIPTLRVSLSTFSHQLNC